MNDQRVIWERTHEQQMTARHLAEQQLALRGTSTSRGWRYQLAGMLRAAAQRLAPLPPLAEGNRTP